jgi:diguanylate cyclase
LPQSAFDLSSNQAAAVLSLLERAEVPPLPVYYGLLFDYVAGVRSLVGARIGSILEDADEDAAEQLYSEFVAPYENKEPLESVISSMVSRLTVLDTMIGRSVAATTENSRSLAAASQHLAAERIDPLLLGEWILRLKVNNDRMRRANEELANELIETQHVLVRTQSEISRSRKQSLCDPLTGVANRAGIDALVQQLLRDEPGQPLSIALIDLDRFKSLNDTHGHQRGDYVLRAVTDALIAAAGSSQMVGRLGGDEFVVVLPGTSLEAAAESAETLRIALTTCDLTDALGGQVLGEITASLGVAELEPGETLAELFERADRCLYRAKHSGRNRVEALIEG